MAGAKAIRPVAEARKVEGRHPAFPCLVVRHEVQKGRVSDDIGSAVVDEADHAFPRGHRIDHTIDVTDFIRLEAHEVLADVDRRSDDDEQHCDQYYSAAPSDGKT